LNGTSETIKFTENEGGLQYAVNFEGIIPFIESQQDEDSAGIRRWVESFMEYKICPECNGTRLKKEALYFKIDNQNISELANKDLTELAQWAKEIESKLDDRQKLISAEVLKEIRKRIKFLLDVGLEYLNLDRTASTLSGGESQRIRLATQIGSQLMGVLYILDEPSIGLHQRDNDKLIQSLKNLRDIGNSVLVVEHDKDMILESDFVVDIGPGAGVHGGEIVAAGIPSEVMKQNTTTADYLNGTKQIEVPQEKRKGNGKFLELKGATGNNLKNVSVKFPLGKFICVTGVSGSGKSTLINETLQPILSQYFYKSVKEPMPFKKIVGLEHIDKVISIDQSPIGRTPRSNPATYTGLFTDIRALFSELPEAKIRGYKPGRFSFNVKGGRCEECQGGGMKVIEMNFLPDVHIKCNTCLGKRYNRETLEVRYKGKSISDVLDMEIAEAVHFFEHIPSIYKKVKTLNDIGLGYITLGQSSVTLSGGEAQRIKLSSELNKNDTGQTFYILDEPTTGLHFEDIRILLNVLNKLADKGNTILVIEHNMDVIKSADYIIDLGMEGGSQGGNILISGTPEKVAESNIGYTAKYLARELKTTNEKILKYEF
jgi:excinuclease ABC subunit A